MNGSKASAIVLLAAATACSRGAASDTERRASTSDATESALDLREAARETLGTNCGECHTRGLSTALPRALAVYDLDEPDFARHMNEAQLREALRRLGEPIGPTLKGGETRELHLAPGERDRFARFVDAELARRDAGR